MPVTQDKRINLCLARLTTGQIPRPNRIMLWNETVYLYLNSHMQFNVIRFDAFTKRVFKSQMQSNATL